MKKKILFGILLIIGILLITAFSYNVKAADGDIEWSDFSNATFKLERNGQASSKLTISNVTPVLNNNGDLGRSYYLFITADANKPSYTSSSAERIYMYNYDSATNSFEITDMKLDKYIELNQDLYVNILELANSSNEEYIVYGKKLDRFAEPKYTDAFSNSYASSDDFLIVTNFTHNREVDRKMQIKIGAITDTEILKKIKNQDSTGFSDLLSFAKTNNNTICNQTVDCNSNNYTIKYDGAPLNINGIQDNVYYYLYVKPDDENGKYYPTEAVTLSISKVYPAPLNSYYLFFYGTEDFKWADFETTPTAEPTTAPTEEPTQTPTATPTQAPTATPTTKTSTIDPTIAQGKLPQTGIDNNVIIAIAIVTTFGTFALYKYIRYKSVD